MTTFHRALLAAFISLSIVGCSGGSKSATPITPAGSSTTTKSGPASSSVTMVIPKAIATQSKSSRSPQYISPSTLGVAVYVFIPPATQPATPTAVADFSATSPACTAGSNGSRSCTITVPAPIGNNDTFVVSTYDQVPAGGQPQGNLLSTNTITGVVITAGSVNTVPLTLNGVPATIVMNPPAVQVPAGQANSFTINVNAKDVDGNYIIGTGTYTNAISLAITGDPNHTLSLSASTVAAPSGSAITVTFTGGSLGTGIITATATGATSSTTTITASNAVSQVTFTIPGFSSQAVYLSDSNSATIARFAANASGSATPTLTIVGGVALGIAVDASNEYVLASNLTINIYPIGAVAGPPAASISGSNTHMCNPDSIAVYSGTIYVVDSCAGLLEYPTTASGNAVPSQQITGANTEINNDAGSIAVNSNGIYVGNRGNNATVVQFALGAGGNATPSFVIPSGSGSFNTGNGAEGLAVDSAGNVYVASGGSNNNVVVFAPGATTASYTITGNGTFCSPQGLALDGLNHIWVANDCWGSAPSDEVIQGFTLGSANANNSPIVTFGGFASINYSRSGCCSSIAVDPSNDIYSANQGINTVSRFNQAGTVLTTLVTGPNGAPSQPSEIAFDSGGNLFETNVDVGTISVFAPGQTTPLRKFFAPPPNNPCSLWGIAVDAAGHAFTADNCNNALTEYPANASSSTTPLLTLSGGGSGLSGPRQINFDYAGNLYVANSNNNTVTVYGNGLIGNGTPTATIGGGSTNLSTPSGVAIDPAGYVYVLNNNPGSITVFAPGAAGNVAPVRTITGLGSGGLGQLAVDQFQNVYLNDGSGFSVWGPAANGAISPNIRVNYPGFGVGIAISPTQP